MSFTTVPFLIFFFVFIVGYTCCPPKYRQYALLAGSLFCCIWGSWVAALSAVAFAVVNFVLAGLMDGRGQKTKRDRILLALAIVADFGALAAVKVIGTLPLGISFYTFTCFAYVMDVYRGTIVASENPATFGAYVTMFPKFQMGPITRFGDMERRFRKPKVSLAGLQEGLQQLALGFCMKVLLADKLAILWNELLTIGYGSLSTPLAWLGLLSFSIQLYLEWQSYSLMAMGVARMMGFRLPENFNYPYLAKTIGDFYRRWHMTLTAWFKDYIYIPLGGNRKGTLRTVANILLIWLLTSVWHGVGWNFILWGMSIGLLIVLEKLVYGKALSKLHVLPHIYVLFFIMLTWCCFKIDDMGDLGAYFTSLFPFFGRGGNVFAGDFMRVFSRFWPYLLGGVVFCFPFVENLVKRWGKNPLVSLLLAAVFWYAVHTMIRQGSNPNMYLNF